MYRVVWEKMVSAKRVALVAHKDPDADSLGSATALYTVLHRMGIRVDLVVASAIPRELDFLPFIHKVKTTIPEGCDVIVTCDCAQWERVGLPRPTNGFLIAIDHHHTHTVFADLALIESQAVSTTQVIYRLLQANTLSIARDTATALYAGLVDDTGFFAYAGVDAEVFAMAQTLVTQGAKPSLIAELMRQRESLAKIRLTALALGTLQLRGEGRCGWVYVTQSMLQQSGALRSDTDELAAIVRSIGCVQIAVMMREESDGTIKVSLRSKGDCDVSLIAQAFGGGGHQRASGLTLPATAQPIDDAMNEGFEQIFNTIRKVVQW